MVGVAGTAATARNAAPARPARAMPLVALALLVALPCAAGQFGDFRHDYLRPDQRDERIEFYGSLSLDYQMAEEEEAGSREWKHRFGDRSRATLWIAGVPFAPGTAFSYFAEGSFDGGEEKLVAGQIRGDIALHSSLRIRAGHFWFPSGIEMRAAPDRVNRFLSRPPAWTRLGNGAAVMGDLFDERIQYFFAFQDDFAGALADSLDGIVDSLQGEATEPAVGGRVAFSPRAGLEVGGSVAWEERDGGRESARILGADFSIHDGPLHVQAEAMRLVRVRYSPLAEPLAPEVTATIFYGRIAYRIIEDTARFDHVEVMLGASVTDPDADQSDDRTTTFSGALAVAPWYGVSFRVEYQAVREQTNEVGNDRVLAGLLLFW